MFSTFELLASNYYCSH